MQKQHIGSFARRLARLLGPAQSEAVLGDLAEENSGGLAAVGAVTGLLLRKVLQVPKLGRKRVLLLAASDAHATAEASWAQWSVPLALGLIVATAAVAFLTPSRTQTLTWPGLFTRSAGLMVSAALAAVAGAFLLHRLYRDTFKKPGAWLLACAWTTAIWIPLLLLVWSQRAIWFVLTPIPIAALLASFSKRQYAALTQAELPLEPAPSPLLFDTPLHQQRERLRPFALIAAFLIEATLFTAGDGDVALASSLVVLTTACLVWAFTPGDLFVGKSSLPGRARLAVLPCFLLTCLALTPFLRAGYGRFHAQGMALTDMMQGAPHVAHTRVRAYTAVVLLAPALPKPKLITAPPKALLGESIHPTRPLTIPFDGAYWFFQSPDRAPRADAEVKHGDPATAHIRSSDYTPIKMEAHQRLGTRLDAGCCRSIAVALTNADNRQGTIEVEAVLRNVHGNAVETVSLGTVPLRSSQLAKISLNRPPVHETLQYSIRGPASNFRFNDIGLLFHLASTRSLAGARVKVESFTLQP